MMANNEFDRDRVKAILTNAEEGRWTVDVFEPWDGGGQKWYTDRMEIIEDVKATGSTIIGSSSCDMRDLLEVCEEREWKMTAKAGGVYELFDPKR